MRRQQFLAAQTAVRNSKSSSDPLILIQSYDSDFNPSRPVKSSPLGSSTIAGLPLELLDRLRAFPLFKSAPETFLLSIGKSLRPNVYQSSQEIIREGEDAKAMYWLVRGSVRVTSRDGESTYAELKPGAFFGEIGILMDVPRTASVVAGVKSMVVRLNKEDLQRELIHYPEVERAIREEATERLAILERKKKERLSTGKAVETQAQPAPRKRSAGDVEMGDAGTLWGGEATSNKKRKSPSPSLQDVAASDALDNTFLTVRQLLKELPLFTDLPSEILHFLGVNVQPVCFPPFTEILKQGSAGQDVYFIVKGEVEVLTEKWNSAVTITNSSGTQQARLRTGQYFGEVTSLSLSPRRTATVRSINEVECLLVSSDILNRLWGMCNAELRDQVEHEARRRMKAARMDFDIEMQDAGVDDQTADTVAGVSTEPKRHDCDKSEQDWRKELPAVRFEEPPFDDNPVSQMEPIDPDPFFNADLDNMRSKSRRSSLAPAPSTAESRPVSCLVHRTPSPPASCSSPLSPLRLKASPTGHTAISTSPRPISPTATRRSSLVGRPSSTSRGRLPDTVLALICQHLDLLDLMRYRLVSLHWWELLNSCPDILQSLNLSQYNRYVTDQALRNVIIPFVGTRPKEIDLSNCFHLTDEGFRALSDACGEGAIVWKMKSVWEVQGPSVLSLVEKARDLEEIDLSNCRKVGDNLLARLVGWAVPEKRHPPTTQRPQHKCTTTSRGEYSQSHPGTVFGASKLKHLTLSYCKHIQDRSMTHIAMHASDRLESIDLTRCTSISDAGFHSWSSHEFKKLRKLVLADCTYLSDQAIVAIVGGCRSLRELDLSFCCALSDTATEVLALGLPALRSLNMAFCGSAVSDNSLRCIGLHLQELRYLSVRGCVRVTGQGVENVVDGCRHLTKFDVSQCKNLAPWLQGGGAEKIRGPWGRGIQLDVVADGSWRVAAR